MKINREPRVSSYEICAKRHDGKIVTRTEKFCQIQFQQNPSVIVCDDGSVELSAAIELIKRWNDTVGNTDYTYSLNM